MESGGGVWFEKAWEGLEVQVMTWEEMQHPPASVQWKESAAITVWDLKAFQLCSQ